MNSQLDTLIARIKADSRPLDEIAKDADVPLGTLAKIVHGHTPNPRFRTVEKLWKVYPEQPAA